MNNLKKFATEAEYTAATLYYPAVSWVTVTDVVHFDKTTPVPPTPTFSGLTVYYNITDISQPTELFKGGGGSGSGSGSGSGGVLPSAMIIDGTAVEVTNTYQFSTTGEHIVNYSFADNQIPYDFLYGDSEHIFNNVVKIIIGDAITSISNEAFLECYGLTSCTIGSGVTHIGDVAFQSCTSLTSIDISDSVTSIGENAFNGCSSLTSCTIGSGVTYIGFYVFESCTSLTSITVEAVDPPQLGNNAFNNTNNCPIYVPIQSVDVYKYSTSTGWSEYASRIQAIQ